MTDTDIKFVLNKNITFIKENRNGEEIIAHYEDRDGAAAMVLSVFFMKIKGESNIVNLISWAGDSKPACYRVYAYVYNENGVITENKHVNNDPRLYGCNSKKNKFLYTNALQVIKFLTDIYDDRK